MLTFDVDIMEKTKVLLIEDNQADARLLEIYLKESDAVDCDITHCVRLGDALDLLNNHQKFDAIFLDLTLPDSTGLETLDRLIAHSPGSNVLVMTGLSDRTLGINAVKSGAQDYIIKGSYDSKSLSKALIYSIERASVKAKLEETQRLAKIGSWEYDIYDKSLYASLEVFRILNINNNGLKLKYENFDEKLKRFIHFVVRKTPKTGKLERNIEIKFDGQTSKHVFFTAKRVSERHGEEKIRGIIQDISSKKKTEDLERQQALTLKSSEMKEKFIASVSHEMRTPMNAILGMSNLVLQTDLDIEQNEYISAIKQSSEMLLGIVNDILEFSSIQNGHVHFENERLNLKMLLDNMVDVMRYKIEEKNLSLSIEIATDVPLEVKGDKQRLNQIIFNLVGNAIKFTKEGTIDVNVSVQEDSNKEVVLLFEVIDTGIGIPEDKVDAVFDSFTRIENKDELFEGTGLGLAISKNFVELQGGHIGAKSQFGQGSTFYFSLPFGKPQGINEEIVKPNINLDIDALDLLLVEDNKLNQMVAKKTLEKQWGSKISVTIADNGQLGYEAVQDKDFDLILMDIQMPVMDGYEALKAIKNLSNKFKRDVPILAMTAHANIANEDRFHNSGFADFVLKPFEPTNLFEKIIQYRRQNDIIPLQTEENMSTESIKQKPMLEYKPDLEYLETITMGDPEMKQTVIEMLANEIPENLEELKGLIHEKNWSETFQASHKLKSTLAYTGSPLLIETNIEIEDITRNNKPKDNIYQLLSILEEYSPKVLDILKAQLK